MTDAPKRPRPLPYFSIIMAIAVLIYGGKTWLDAQEMEADLVAQYVAEYQDDNPGATVTPAQREGYVQQAAADPKVQEQYSNAQWMLIASILLTVVVFGFFMAMRYLAKPTE